MRFPFSNIPGSSVCEMFDQRAAFLSAEPEIRIERISRKARSKSAASAGGSILWIDRVAGDLCAARWEIIERTDVCVCGAIAGADGMCVLKAVELFRVERGVCVCFFLCMRECAVTGVCVYVVAVGGTGAGDARR